MRAGLLTTAALLLAATSGIARTIPENAEWMPGEVLLKLRAASFESNAYQPELASQGRTGLAGVDAEMIALDATVIETVFSLEMNAERKRELGMDRVFLVQYGRSETPPEAAERLSRLPEVEYAHPNGIGHATLTPNDPTYRLQWAHRNRGQAVQADGDSIGTWDCDIDTNQAWDLPTGSNTVVIAVLDTGLDAAHPEFSGRVLSGFDFVNQDANPTDDQGHGTCCAGIAAAAGNNGQGVAGVAWGAQILPVKVLNAIGGGVESDLVQGITYAADSGADILSMSLGGYAHTQTLQNAVIYAHDLDCTLIASSGNADASTVAFPAAYAEVIAVGAISPCNERKSPTSCDGENWWGSNYGTALDLVAPGVLIHTTDVQGAGGYENGSYETNFNGTSAAAPFVSGVAALVLSHRSMTGPQLERILHDSCDDLGAAGYDQETGFGRINAYVAVRSATSAVFVGTNFGTELGTYESPYNTVVEGVNAVGTGNWVVVKPGDYNEATPWFINKNVQVDAIDGGVTIR